MKYVIVMKMELLMRMIVMIKRNFVTLKKCHEIPICKIEVKLSKTLTNGYLMVSIIAS